MPANDRRDLIWRLKVQHCLNLTGTSQQQGRLNFVSTSSHSPSKRLPRHFPLKIQHTNCTLEKRRGVRAQSFHATVQNANNEKSVRKAVYIRTKSISVTLAASAYGKATGLSTKRSTTSR